MPKNLKFKQIYIVDSTVENSTKCWNDLKHMLKYKTYFKHFFEILKIVAKQVKWWVGKWSFGWTSISHTNLYIFAFIQNFYVIVNELGNWGLDVPKMATF